MPASFKRMLGGTSRWDLKIKQTHWRLLAARLPLRTFLAEKDVPHGVGHEKSHESSSTNLSSCDSFIPYDNRIDLS